MIYKIDLDEIRMGKSIAYDNKVKRLSPVVLNITEKNIEDYIANNIKEVLPTTDLMTIFQERKWQEEPDIMAMNGKGDLYIFELKRIQASEDNILQLLRYAQKFGSYEYSEINKIYQVYKNDNQFSLLDDLNKNLGNNILSQNDINNKQHLYLITNGTNEDTIKKIKFWKSNGLDINLIIYWIFENNGNYFIEFNICKDLEGLLEYEKRYYIVNTNSRFTQNFNLATFLNEEKVAIQGDIKNRIKTFKKGDIIFLYQNGDGIVARGEIKDNQFYKKDWNGVKEDEYYMELSDFKRLTSKNYLTKKMLDEICKRNFVLTPTIIYLSENEGKDIDDSIKNL